MPEDVEDVVLNLAVQMMKLAGVDRDITTNKVKALEVIKNGKALEKLKELVAKQGGDVSYIDNPEKFEKAPIIMPVIAKNEGYVFELNAEIVGKAGVELGVGRKTKDEVIDPRLGFVFVKKIGDKVAENDVLAYVHADTVEKAEKAIETIQTAYRIKQEPATKKRNVFAVI